MSGEGERRKSARIAAIEARKSDKSKGDTFRPNGIPSSVNGQTARRKSIKRRSLAEFSRTSISPSTQQVGGEENNGNLSNGNGNLSFGHPLPEKRFLDNALDILQRRDKRDLFARPVDSDVEDYYEVIDEPMDFSTIRTKLHTEVYTTFEEFEHDVFLISGNAMFFNGENTSYYKQARAIFELSKRVLETLKRDPEKLEQLKRNPSRELRRPVQRSRSRRRGRPRLYRSLSLNLLSDQGGSQSHGPKEFIPPRESYKPSEFIVSKTFDGPRTFVPGDGSGYGYRNSLMQFTKNLGPVAQRVAARKLSLLSAQPHQPSFLQETNLVPSPFSVSRESSSGAQQETNLTMPKPVRDERFHHRQSFFNQTGTLNMNNHIAGTTSDSSPHNLVPPNQWAHGSRSSLHRATATNVRRTSEPSVRSFTYLRPSRFSAGTSFSQMNLSPSPVVVNQVEPVGSYLRLLTMDDEGTSNQEAQYAAINMQPLAMIQWAQNENAKEDFCGPSESISMGMNPARSPYPQRLGLSQPGMDEQAGQAVGTSQQVYGQWRSTLLQDPHNLRRQLMPPPGDRSKRPPPPPGI